MTRTDRTRSRADRGYTARRRPAAATILLAFALMAGACGGTTQETSDATIGAPGTTDAKPDGAVQALSIVEMGSGTETAFTAPSGASQFDFTLDGSTVTYTDIDENGIDQVFMMDANGSNQRQLTHGTLGVTLSETPPQWSPNGSKIAYWVSLPAGGVEIFVVRVSDGVSTRVTNEPRDVFEGGWASDRSFVFSISNSNSDYPLLARSIDLATGETVTIARDVSNPEVSPDGKQIAFDSYFRPQGEVWLSLMNIDGTGRREVQELGSIGSAPKWSPDSTRVAIDSTADGGLGTYVYDLDTGETRFVTAGTMESWVDNDHILAS